jgi:hypothetical protein
MMFIKQTFASGSAVGSPVALPPSPSRLHIEDILVYPIQGCSACHVKDDKIWNVTSASLQLGQSSKLES